MYRVICGVAPGPSVSVSGIIANRFTVRDKFDCLNQNAIIFTQILIQWCWKAEITDTFLKEFRLMVLMMVRPIQFIFNLI